MLGDVKLMVSDFSVNGVDEFHLIATSDSQKQFEGQLKDILDGLTDYLHGTGIPVNSVVFVRYFVSDYANQAHTLHDAIDRYSKNIFRGCAVSVVQQPPLGTRKIAVWAYAVYDRSQELHKTPSASSRELTLKRGKYEHIWNTRLLSGNGLFKSSDQTDAIFSSLQYNLQHKNYSIKDNCIRTWLFVRDIDFNYNGVVESRKAFFEKCGMTRDTHFIASTGIEGQHADPDMTVMMDAYSLGGILPEQVRFLQAPNHLNPTHEYGVTFERGTSVDFGDRRQIYISGTASIDNKGEVVHRTEITMQIARTLANISALLADADAALEDVAQMIVYLRDPADSETVNDYLDNACRQIPRIVVLAPVCRPGWLVEIECIAIREKLNPAFANF